MKSYLVVKRIFDFIFAVNLLIFLSPIMFIVAIFIKVGSEGPIFFKQDRLGLNGQVFKIYKFRSMVVNAEKIGTGVYSYNSDPRVTKVGKFIRKTSLDELPQLFNIIKGEMSIIGPRPTLVYHPWTLDKYTEEQKMRFNIRPGITGLAQVNGRKEVPWSERIILDVDYVNNVSLWLDIKIFFKTIIKVLTMNDNYNTSKTARPDASKNIFISKVLLTNSYRFNDEQLHKIKSLGYEVSLWRNEFESLTEELLDAEVVVCNGLFLHNDISKFPNLKMIQITSAGLDRLPLNEIRERGIILANARGVYSIPMAEWVVLKILEIYKNTRYFEDAQRVSEWKKNRELLELNNKTIGIIGTGSVGTEVAKRVKAFGTTVIGFNTSGVEEEYFDKCIITSELNSVLNQCDVIVLTLPLTNKTKNMINKETLGFMKADAVLINVSRGEVVNETDLLEHINRGKLKGVALDVFEEEPLVTHSPLWKHPRILVTPHNSFVSDNVSSRVFKIIYENLKAYIESKPLKNEIGIK